MRLFVRRRGVHMALFAVFLSGGCMLHRLVVRADVVMVSRLQMVMGGGVMMRRSLMMVLARRVPLRLCHETSN